MNRPYLVFRLAAIFFSLSVTACAYRIGSPDRSLPGGYRQVFVPIFKNKSMEPGVEVSFTNALIQEFERAKIGRVTEENQAEVIAEGEIESISYTPQAKREYVDEEGKPNNELPVGSVLAAQYQILITTRLTLMRSSDRSVLWSGTFNGETTYIAPQVIAAGINSVNPLYNLSARRQNIDSVANKMMSEAHDRITENF